jgi:hypothetical protein
MMESQLHNINFKHFYIYTYRQSTKIIKVTMKIFGIMETWHMGCVQLWP